MLVKNCEVVYVILFEVFETESFSELLALDLVKDLDSEGKSFVLALVDCEKKFLL